MELNKNEMNFALKWDYLKCEIRGHTISYASHKAKVKRSVTNQLKHRLGILEANLNEENIREYKCVKKDLEDIYNEEARGHFIRSRSNIIEESPENLKYFSKLEIKNANSKYIKTLKVNETLISDPDEILKAQKEYYENLYKEQNVAEIDESLFQNIAIPQLDILEKEICDQSISIKELGTALMELPNNKTPGSDGLTTEFYKFFWSKIKVLVHKSIEYAFTNKSLSIEQRRGILSIIPKKDKDLRYLANWRPLTLLNTDYKILTKLLALRLQKVLPAIISKDQSGYLKGRYIGDNIRTIFDVIEFAKINQIPGMIVLIDFEKAFDSISWSFLFRTLDAFNFGDSFKQWIKIIYNNPECCVTNNGYASSFFSISRGIRQGCPISALLFLLVVEIMSLHIKQNPDIVGICVGDESIKVSQLADDTTLFLKDTYSLNEALLFLDKFKKSSGLKLNKGKTEVIWIGSKIYCNEKPLGLKITKSSVRCLGILCHTDIDNAVNENFELKVKKIKKLLGMWSQRNLSLKGRITFLRTMVLPIILYPASVLHIPNWVIFEVDKLFFSFVWCYKKPGIRKEVLIASIEEGGLKMPHFESIVKGMKCTWVKRLLDLDKVKTDMLRSFIQYRKYSVKEIIKCKLALHHVNFNSDFYKQVFESWFEVYGKIKENQIINQSLWDNKFVEIGNKPAYMSNMVKDKILYVCDVLDNSGKILSKQNLEQKYNTTIKQMEYNCLVHALPKNWKNVNLDNQCTINRDYDDIYVICDNFKSLKLEDMNCKLFTRIFVSKIVCRPVAEIKWYRDLKTDDIEWNFYYTLAFKTTKDTKIQSLQYYILNRIYPCNYWLSKWNDDVSSTCNFCDKDDDLEHYFFKCESLHLFWDSIRHWWYNNLGCTFNLSTKDVILGLCNAYDDESIFDNINYIILLAKYYIMKCRKRELVIEFQDFIHYMKQKLEVEIVHNKILGMKEIDLIKWYHLYNLV